VQLPNIVAEMPAIQTRMSRCHWTSLTAFNASLLDEQIGHKWSRCVIWRISFSWLETLQKVMRPLLLLTPLPQFQEEAKGSGPVVIRLVKVENYVSDLLLVEEAQNVLRPRLNLLIIKFTEVRHGGDDDRVPIPLNLQDVGSDSRRFRAHVVFPLFVFPASLRHPGCPRPLCEQPLQGVEPNWLRQMFVKPHRQGMASVLLLTVTRQRHQHYLLQTRLLP